MTLKYLGAALKHFGIILKSFRMTLKYLGAALKHFGTPPKSFGMTPTPAAGRAERVGASWRTSGLSPEEIHKIGLLGQMAASPFFDDFRDSLIPAEGSTSIGRNLLMAGWEDRASPIEAWIDSPLAQA